jgi:hypothetical protein
MTIEDKKLEGYITLKEASELFDYSPDYIGQLIRKGKIEGKQVYANVAWMTTKSALDEYLAREKGSREEPTPLSAKVMQAVLSDEASQLATWLLRALIPVLVLVLLVVFYFVSISIDHKLALDAQRKLEARMMVAGVGVTPLSSTDGTFTYEK